MAELAAPQLSRSAGLRRPLIGGLLSALVSGAIQAVQIWVFPLLGYAWPSMRMAALLTGASVPGLFLGDRPLALVLALNLAFWFCVGFVIGRLAGRNAVAVLLWLAALALADLSAWLLLFTYMTGISGAETF